MSEKKPRVVVLMTTFNRCDNTKNCILSLTEKNPELDMRFVVTDDKSQDGTEDMLLQLGEKIKIHLIKGNGSLFWTGGMYKSLEYALVHSKEFDYALLVNDDVEFYDNAIENLKRRLEKSNAKIIVGATEDADGNMSYGGVKKLSRFFAKFGLVEPSEEIRYCDTFNCNCVLMSSEIFGLLGNLDNKYIHSMGDFDYGLMATKKGFKIVSSDSFVGRCSDNDVSKSWRNPKLPRSERLKLKESPKGLPRKDWFHFVNKNYGFISALYHTATPYIRILIGK